MDAGLQGWLTMNAAEINRSRLVTALNSEGFRDEVRRFMRECDVTLDDFREFRFAQDPHTGGSMIVLELNDGRQRAFPFSPRTTH